MKRLWTSLASILLTLSLQGVSFAGSSFAETKSNLFGSWAEPCSVLDDGRGSISISYTFTNNDFFSDNFFISGNVFSDSNCRHIALSHIFYGQYRAGGRYGDGFRIDIDYDRRFVTGFHPDDISAMNQINYCGFGEWRFGISRLVSIKSCDKAFAPKLLAKMKENFGTIYDIRTTSKGYTYLVFGQGTEDGSRPTRLDLSRKFIKQ